MKKIFALAAIALFTMTSCSDDSSSENNNNNTDAVLVKKIIETSEEGTLTTLFTYNGNKIVKVANSDGTYETYSYTDAGITFDLIQSSKFYDSDDTVIEETSYIYNNQNKLVTATTTYYDEGDIYISRVEYTHNADGTITWEDYGNTSEVIESGKIYSNKFERIVPAVDVFPEHIDITTYAYDGKNNPFKNITGLDKISFAGSEEGLIFDQNIISETHSNTLGVNEVMSTTTYTYNSGNYPLTSETDEMGYVTNTQYFYE